jgi:hypothetical protein
LVVAQLILLSWWFRRKTNKKDVVKTIGSKSISSIWHFCQIGHGGKKTLWKAFFIEILGQENQDFL